MIRVYASDAPELVALAERIAMLTNPQLFADMRDMPDVERRAALDEAMEEMEEMSR